MTIEAPRALFRAPPPAGLSRRGLLRSGLGLTGLAGLILPGGESTTISKGLGRLALYEPIDAFARAHPLKQPGAPASLGH